MLAESDEGRAAAATLDEPDDRGGWPRGIPLIGRVVSFISDLVRMPSTVIDLHRRQLAAIEGSQAAKSSTAELELELRSLSDKLARRLDDIQASVSGQGEHSRVEAHRQAEQFHNGLSGQMASLSDFARTQLPQATTLSYLTCFMDVRQSRLSMQLAAVQQNILDSMRQIVERMEPDYTSLLSALTARQDSDREAIERLLENVALELRGSGQEINRGLKESAQASRNAFETFTAALQHIGLEAEGRLAESRAEIIRQLEGLYVKLQRQAADYAEAVMGRFGEVLEPLAEHRLAQATAMAGSKRCVPTQLLGLGGSKAQSSASRTNCWKRWRNRAGHKRRQPPWSRRFATAPPILPR